jgi:hypothetical protein
MSVDLSGIHTLVGKKKARTEKMVPAFELAGCPDKIFEIKNNRSVTGGQPRAAVPT